MSAAQLELVLNGLRGRHVHLVGITSLEIADVAVFLARQGLDGLVGHDLCQPEAMAEHFRAAHIGMEASAREAHWQALSSSGVALRLGDRYLEGIEDAQVIIVGQAWRVYPQNRPLHAALGRGASAMTPMQLYLDLVDPARVATVGVTGSNGKSTTTNMVASILQTAGIPVVLAGNYRYRGPILDDLMRLGGGGQPPVSLSAPTVGRLLAASMPSGGWSVLLMEVSNHHLLALQRGMDVAIVTNVTPNHLEEHDGLAGYVASKRRMAELQDAGGLLIVNADDPISREFAFDARGAIQRFSLQDPAADGFCDGTRLLMRGPDGGPEAFAETSDLRVVGRHNWANALAASLAARSLGVQASELCRGLTTFEGAPGRLEAVRRVGQIDFIYDIESTTPESTLRGLETFRGRPVHLIAGGDNKGLDYRELVAQLRAQDVRVYLLPGDASDAMGEAAEASGFAMIRCATVEEAVERAFQHAEANAVVLLSPAAKGFYNRHIRGQSSFARLVKRLKQGDRGPG